MNNPAYIHDRQHGAALIVGLILMTVLTLLAVSTMRTSTLELAMAGNTQYHAQAIQLAEAGLGDAIDQINNGLFLNTNANWQTSYSQTVNTPDGNAPMGRYNITIRYKNCGDPPSGQSTGGKTMADFFEVESTGLSASRNAKSTLVQGFWRTHTGSCPI